MICSGGLNSEDFSMKNVKWEIGVFVWSQSKTVKNWKL